MVVKPTPPQIHYLGATDLRSVRIITVLLNTVLPITPKHGTSMPTRGGGFGSRIPSALALAICGNASG